MPAHLDRLRFRSQAEPDPDGALVQVTAQAAQWRYAALRVYRLGEGQSLRRDTGDEEACLVFLGGRGQLSTSDRDWGEIGDRATPFDGPPHAVYLPPRTSFALAATTPRLEVAMGTAPAREGVAARHIRPDDVRVQTRGWGTMERTIHDILMEGQEQTAESLLVTEVLTPGGHWSSYPPHKHDTEDLPREAYLEEIYYHRLKRPDGYAIQRVYTYDRGLDTTLAVRDGDVVTVPRGYHPVSAAPGYDLYYLNVMAGPVRQWRVTMDPDLEWLVSPPEAFSHPNGESLRPGAKRG